jgi:hypothetical protein
MTKTKKIWIAWAVLYGICTVLSFILTAPGTLSGLMTVLSIGFFVPGLLLLLEGKKKQDTALLKKLRLVCLLSLGLTVLAIVLNFFSANGSAAWGIVAWWFLLLVSTPMVCSQIWVISLFLWAFLLMGTITCLRKK